MPGTPPHGKQGGNSSNDEILGIRVSDDNINSINDRNIDDSSAIYEYLWRLLYKKSLKDYTIYPKIKYEYKISQNGSTMNPETYKRIISSSEEINKGIEIGKQIL